MLYYLFEYLDKTMDVPEPGYSNTLRFARLWP